MRVPICLTICWYCVVHDIQVDATSEIKAKIDSTCTCKKLQGIGQKVFHFHFSIVCYDAQWAELRLSCMELDGHRHIFCAHSVSVSHSAHVMCICFARCIRSLSFLFFSSFFLIFLLFTFAQNVHASNAIFIWSALKSSIVSNWTGTRPNEIEVKWRKTIGEKERRHTKKYVWFMFRCIDSNKLYV